ncbi:hypothetical protein, partial [Nocardia sp. NPDC058497]|uniref:hypothetical protein n=1 Tax=Nocardia sp. NPDC058497 TaxID=3346529 RepID=UPI003669D800
LSVTPRETAPRSYLGATHAISTSGLQTPTPRGPGPPRGASHIKAMLALAYYMRLYGVYLPELHTIMLSDAHSYADLDAIAAAFRKSIRDMKQQNFFAY